MTDYPPPPNESFKNMQIIVLVYSSGKDSLRSAKNMIEFLFCIWSAGQRGVKLLHAPIPGYATVYSSAKDKFLAKNKNEKIALKLVQ